MKESTNAAAKAEHERNEATIAALTGLLALAPKEIRRRADWEALLPQSGIPPPTDPAVYLDQAEGRAREAAEKLRKPLYLYLIPFFVKGRFQKLKDREAERVLGLCRLLGGDAEAVKGAVSRVFEGLFLPFKSGVRFEPAGGGSGRVEIDLPGEEVIPSRRSSLLKDGRISYRAWPERERNEAYARLVASIALLFAARALDAAPSLESVLAEGFSPAIDPRTGKDSVVCLISVLAERGVLAQLRLDRIDPVAALSNFRSRFEVGRGAALKEVEALSRAPEALVEEVPAESPRLRREARRAAAPPAARASPAPPPAGAPDQEGEVAADALRVAVACARSDGRFEEPEIRAIEKLIEERFSPTALEKKRLDLLREELKVGSIDVGRASSRLRARLTPLERRLLVEGILSALLAKGSAAQAEIGLLEAVAQKLDLPPLSLKDMQRRAGASTAGPAPERERWLAALELPADSNLTRPLVERSAKRVLDTFAEERFAALGVEFQAMARKRREGAEEARRGLLAALPEEAAPTPPAPADGNADEPRRDNPDLDAIFG